MIDNPENKENQSFLANAYRQVVSQNTKCHLKVIARKKQRTNSITIIHYQSQSTKKGQPDEVTNNKESSNITEENSIEAKKKRYEEIELYYLKEENTKLFKDYGDMNYKYSKQLEQVKIAPTLLKKHIIKSDIHMKMIDWMIEVLSVFHCSQSTFFLSVNIMDLYIHKCLPLTLKTEHIHLIGIASMFIASKFEDVTSIRLSYFVSKISHNQFTKQAITQEERKILDTISIENLICVSIYDFIATYYFDFKQNNKTTIESMKANEILQEMENTSKYLSKMIIHFEFFYNYTNSAKAIACIMTSLQLIKDKSTRFNNKQENLFFEWIQFIIQESEYSLEFLHELYSLVANCHENFNSLSKISRNINKFYPLKIQ